MDWTSQGFRPESTLNTGPTSPPRQPVGLGRHHSCSLRHTHTHQEEEFDEYAEEFEEHLVTVLDYKLPEALWKRADDGPDPTEPLGMECQASK